VGCGGDDGTWTRLGAAGLNLAEGQTVPREDMERELEHLRRGLGVEAKTGASHKDHTRFVPGWVLRASRRCDHASYEEFGGHRSL
jgi:hypothetical protein